jgi:hypothetical protein
MIPQPNLSWRGRMTAYDVFVSYARTDTARARLIRDRLKALGLSVFFDTEGIDTGEEFPVIIDRAVKSAKCVLGLWSRNAFTGRWVRIESRIGLDQNKLVPALLDGMRPEELPAEFYNVNVVSLADFHGEDSHEGWQRIVRSIGKRVGRSDLARAPASNAAQTAPASPLARIKELNPAYMAAAGLALIVGVSIFQSINAPSATANRFNAPVFTAEAAASTADVSGRWSGVYTEAGRETRFELQLQRGDGSAFAGSLSEQDIYGIAGGGFTAEISGEVMANGVVRFTKTYPAGAIPMRPVIYEGRLSNDGRTIAGSWDTGTLHGPFQMERL